MARPSPATARTPWPASHRSRAGIFFPTWRLPERFGSDGPQVVEIPGEGYNPVAVRTLSVPLRVEPGSIRSKHLLALAGDERLVAHVRRGNEAAFEVVYERYVPGILGFCRHMLGSREEAEDAVQQVFASAY